MATNVHVADEYDSSATRRDGGWRRLVVGVIAGVALLAFLGMSFTYAMSAGALYYGLSLRPGPGTLAGALDAWYDILTPVRLAIYAMGLVSIYVLAATFAFSGKAKLHRRSVLWWIAAGLLGLLILSGQGGKYLPFVDFGSNTEAFFEHLAHEQYGAGAFLWLIVALFAERGIAQQPPGDESPSFRQQAAAKSPWVVAFALTALACLAIAQGGNETREAGSSYQSIERSICNATDVLVGTARDFEVVREHDCLAYDDSRPNEGPSVLGRCESLQFKVDVLEQIWPLPGTGQRVEPVRTFRQSKVRGDFAKLRDRFSVGHYDGRVGAHGPHVFYGRSSREHGLVLLGNTWREGIVSVPAQRDQTRYVESAMPRCAPRYGLGEKVRMACPWDYAFVGVARSINPAPPGRRPASRPHYAESARQVPASLVDGTVLEEGSFIEVVLEVLDDFDPLRPAPRDRRLFTRLRVPSRTELGNLRAHWFDEAGKPIRSVFFAFEDRTEVGLLDGSRKWDEHGMLFPGWKYDLNGPRAYPKQAKQRLQECAVARAVFAGDKPPEPEKEPPTPSELYHEAWNKRIDNAVAKVCAAVSPGQQSVEIAINIGPDGKIRRVAIKKPSKDEPFDQRVVAALKSIEGMPPFPQGYYKNVNELHLSRSYAPAGGWCWGR